MIITRLKISFTAISAALFSIDYSVVSSDKVEMLLNSAPEKEEVEMFLSHPPEDLSNAALPD
jgi:hypothetical protein